MSNTQIFTVGGTVQASNGIYIPRRADDELLALCRGGNFGYVLTPRQLGKSSLMVRTAEQLSAEGVRSVIIDLSQIGVQVSPEEWYLGLLSMIEEQLDLDTNAVNWWRERGHLGVTQRLTMFFEEVLLKEVDAPVVVFVDEIDTTLSLNFTDDFFAAIRYFYNARAVSKDVRRLSFVLIGVATPGDLIRDPQRTPFNIGQRVDLTDFTLEEALPFASGFGLADREARQVLGWVLKWTGGHPYLTQRLCRALTEGGRTGWSEGDVDDVVSKTFFGRISEEDNNLQFVRDMLTKRAPDLSEVLYTYREVLNHKHPVQDEEQSLVKSHLKLSGVAQRRHGELSVRNPIYARVFNNAWVKQHLPVNWTKRLTRVAIGLVLTLMVLSVPTSIWAIAAQRRAIAAQRSATAERDEANRQRQLAIVAQEEAVNQRDEANKLRAVAERQTMVAMTEREKAEQARQDTENQRKLAVAAAEKEKQARQGEGVQRQKAEEAARRAEALAENAVKLKAKADVARVEAEKSAVLARAAEQEAQRLRDKAEEESKTNALQRDIAQGQHQMSVASQLVDQGQQRLLSGNTPDAELFLARALTLNDRPETRSALLEASAKNAQTIWETRISKSVGPTQNVVPALNRFDVSLTTRNVVLARPDGSVSVVDLENGREIPKPFSSKEPTSPARRRLLSSDGKYLTSQTVDGAIRVWNVETGEIVRVPRLPLDDVIAVGPTNLVFGRIGQIVSVNIDTGNETRIEISAKSYSTAFSNDLRMLAVEGAGGPIEVSSLETGEKLYTLNDGPSSSYYLEFSKDGKALISVSESEAGLWDLQTGKRSALIPNVRGAAFSSDGSTLATAGDDGIRIWDVQTGRVQTRLQSNSLDVRSLMLGPGGALLAAQDRDGTTKILDVKTGELSGVLHSDGLLIGFSPDGRRLYSIDNNILKAWNLRSDHGKILLARHSGPVTSVVFSIDGDRLASSGGDKTVKIWNTQTGEQFATLTRDQKIQGLIGFDPQRQRLGSFESQGDGIVYSVLDTSTGKEIAATPYNALHSTRAVASIVRVLSPDGRVLAMEKGPGAVTIHNLETGKELTLGSFIADHRGYDVLAFSGDSSQLAGAIDGTVRIWDLETGKESLVLNSGKEIQALYFSVDKKRLALVTGNLVEIWDTAARKTITSISKITGRVSGGLFSPDGRWFAASVENRRIKLWDAETGRLIQTISTGALINNFIFSPDGKWLVSSAEDLRLWSLEVKNPEEGFILPGSGGSNAAFDREQRWLAYGGPDGRVRLWDFEAIKHTYAADHWAILKKVNAETNRKVGGLDFGFLSQFQLRDVLGDKYNPSYSLASLSEADNAQDDERDRNAELRENSPRSQATQGGSISGTIDFRGERPEPFRIDSSADPVCGVVNPNLTTEDWVVTDGKLANVFVYVKSGSGLDNYVFETPTSEVVLEHKKCRSIPHLLGIQVHQVLKLVNSDPTMHNYHITPRNNPDWNQSMPQGGLPLYHEFDRKETFIPVKDNQHPWVKSYIGVFSHPFFAVSAKDGSYAITGLPPGRYTIAAWHERGANGSEQTFEVTIGPGESKTIDFSFSKP